MKYRAKVNEAITNRSTSPYRWNASTRSPRIEPKMPTDRTRSRSKVQVNEIRVNHLTSAKTQPWTLERLRRPFAISALRPGRPYS